MTTKFKKFRLYNSMETGKLCFLFILSFMLCSQVLSAKDNIIKPQFQSKSLYEFTESLIKQTDYNFIFNEQELNNVILKSDINIFNREIDAILKDIDAQIPIEYEINGNNISIRVVPKKEQQKVGRLQGTVYDSNNIPLPGANVIIENYNLGTSTGFEGDYSISILPGSYTVRVSYISFQTQRITDVVIEEGETLQLDVLMVPSSESLEEVVVTAQFNERVNTVAALNTIRKNDVTTLDGITAEQITRTPDNNAAQALKRVTGINLQNDKYIVVRGVSERYNNAAMNGTLMPSTEPNRRNYAFDIVPSNLISSIVVHKSASANLTGEFTGGYVNVNTIDIPVEDFLSVKVGTGGNENTFKDFYSFPRNEGDYLAGLGKSTDILPDFFREQSGNTNRNDPENFTEVSKIMPGNDRFRVEKYTQQPTQDYAISFGKLINTSNREEHIGISGALTYRNEQSKEDYYNHNPKFELNRGYLYNFLSRIGGVFNISYSLGKHNISFKKTFYRKLESQTTDLHGLDRYEGDYKLSFIEQRFINNFDQNLLTGEHILNNDSPVKLKWNLGVTNYNRDQPSNLQVRGDSGRRIPIEDYERGLDKLSYDELFKPPYSYKEPSAARNPPSDFYSYYEEHRYNFGFDLEVPFSSKNLKEKFQFGYLGSMRDVDFEQHRFGIMPVNSGREYGIPLYEVINQEVFDKGLMYYRPLSSGFGGPGGLGNGYHGNQSLNAAYFMVDKYFIKKLHFSGGIRMEANTIVTNSLEEEKVGEEVSINEFEYTLSKTNFLPSVNLIYEVTSNMNIRGAYYTSIARPEFTELGKYSYFDPYLRTYIVSGYETDDSGNPISLEQTTIENAELRWEFYPSANESFSIAGFYKSFDKPIELTLNTGTRNQLQRASYHNLKSARNYGLELDFRKNFGFLGTGFGENLYLFGNASLIWSTIYFDNVEAYLDTGETDDEGLPIYQIGVEKEDRQLYGQAPYIVNGGLQYVGKHLGLSATYNRVGPRIILPSEDPFTSQYEKPRNVLDFQIRYAFLKDNRAEVKLNLSDILNDPVIQYNNNRDPETNLPRAELIEVSDEGEARNVFEPLHDPSGDNYDPKYDMVVREFLRQRSFSLSFQYTF